MKHARNETGFTLVEMLISLVIGALVLTMGVPSFSAFIKNNRMTTQVNDFVSTANIARSEAVKRGARIVVCKSNNGTTCDTGSNGWEQGWIAFVDIDKDGIPEAGETLVSVKGAMTEGTTLKGNTDIADFFYFNANGTTNFSARASLVSYGEIILCDSRMDTTKSRAISITAVGRLETMIGSESDMSCV